MGATLKLGSNRAPYAPTMFLSGGRYGVSYSGSGGGYVRETDPVFLAWDKSTGILISQAQITPEIIIDSSQISDISNYATKDDLAALEPDLNVQYLVFLGGERRIGVRDDVMVIDGTMSALGFDGEEDTDWYKIADF